MISESATLLALSVFVCDRKRGYGGHFGFINFNKLFLFSGECLETWRIYMFLRSASLLTLSVFMCDPNRGHSGYLDFIIDLLLLAYIVLEAVVADLWTF